MLDKQKTQKLFSIIGNVTPILDKKFNKLFEKIPEIGYQGLLVFMVMNDIEDTVIDEIKRLGKRHFGLLLVLIEEKNFNDAYLCSRWESIMPVWNFLKRCDSEYAMHLRRLIQNSGGLKIVHSFTKDLHLSE
ncbi:hypothetical protein GF369_03960 [Candidatus Peregrinibacteria bacterium]|nr:hypothetical protein [Candidatus Peregrinibacteria bacterium]